MYKIASIFIFVIYILPFTIVLDTKFFFEYFQVITILLAFILGGYIVHKPKYKEPIDYTSFYIFNNKILFIIFIIYFLLNLNLYIDILKHLLVYKDYTHWLLENTIARYAGELDTGPIKKISTILFMIYMILLGAYQGGNKKIYYFLLFLLFIAETAALSRATVLMGFVAFFIEYLIRNNCYFSMLKSKQIVKIGLYVFFLLAIIFFFSAYFRVQNETNIEEILLKKIGEYIIAHYEALFMWMQNINDYANTYGFSTFTALYKIFTNVEVQSGFYDGVNTSYGHTVIFTTIRGFLADFGYIVTVFLFFIFGFLIKYFTYHRMTFISYFFIRIILFLLLYIFYSPFLFATVFVAYMLSYFILIVQKIKIARRSRYVQN